MIACGVIIFGLLYVSYISLQKENYPLGEISVKGMFSLLELVTMFYIGGSVVDSANITSLITGRTSSVERSAMGEIERPPEQEETAHAEHEEQEVTK